jgi:hypothetical protein
MGLWAERHEARPEAMSIAFAALAGALLVSYSRARTEASAGIHLSERFLGLISRDVRMLAFAIGVALHQAFWTLAIVAVVSHLTVVWRLALLRKELPHRGPEGEA